MTFNNNMNMPTLGLGTWRSEKNAVGLAVEKAIVDYGYRHIDCAHIYKNEKEIGTVFNNIFSTNKVLRKDVFVTSKLWNTEHHPDNVEAACRQTLKDLQLEYLDLYLMHWGIAFARGRSFKIMGIDGLVKTEPVSVRQTWEAMEKLAEKGLVKNIGVANFTTTMIVDLLSYAKIRPAMNQIEIHPYNTQEELVDYCHKQKIGVTAYSPLGSSEGDKDRPLNNEIVIKIAEQIKKTPAQVLIRWALQRDLVVIPKSTNTSRIAENIDVYDFKLSKQEMNKLNGLNRNHRFVDPFGWWGMPYFK